MLRINLENNELSNPLIKKGLRYGVSQLPDANATLTVDMGPVIMMVGTASSNDYVAHSDGFD